MSEITGIGTKFMKDDGGSFSEIARVFGITGPGMSRDSVEVTAYDSPKGYRKKIGGLRDAGQVTFTLNFQRSTYITLKNDYEKDDPQLYKIVLPDQYNTEFVFNALITEMPLSIPEGDRVTVDITIELSGEVTDSFNT